MSPKLKLVIGVIIVLVLIAILVFAITLLFSINLEIIEIRSSTLHNIPFPVSLGSNSERNSKLLSVLLLGVSLAILGSSAYIGKKYIYNSAIEISEKTKI